jgi:hypothetical protein
MRDELPSFLCRAYYVASVEGFLEATPETVLGTLTANSDMAVEPLQRNAWLAQIGVLKTALSGLTGTLFLEFNIPRMGRRIDAVLISGAAILVIEFKVGESDFHRDDIDQVWDYALDLKNFHQASHNAPILPILVATAARTSEGALPLPRDDLVYPPALSNAHGLRSIIDMALCLMVGPSLDADWGAAPYHPTPSIIEAAQNLYAQHSVDAIARHDAGARNLRVTSRRIEELVDEARAWPKGDLLCHRSAGCRQDVGRSQRCDKTQRPQEANARRLPLRQWTAGRCSA